MNTFKGIIALDIDGTITVQKHQLEESVNTFLNHLIANGWLIAFVTGRTFSFAWPILSKLQGEFFFGVQNGAALYGMPSGKLAVKHSIERKYLRPLDDLFFSYSSGLLVESGRENGDICYYRREDFSPSELDYIDYRISISPEKWETLSSFDDLESLKIKDFAVGKFFADEQQSETLSKRVEEAGFKVTTIRDPFRPNYFITHINHPLASKGSCLNPLLSRYPNIPLIAAGDDTNDIEMIKRGDIKIVMQNAPKSMHAFADIVAQPANEQGIIPALKEAIKRCTES